MVSKKKIFIPRLLFSLSLACIAGDGYANGIIDDISPVVMQDGKTLSGLVLDETGPVIGASVIVKGTTVGTVTDIGWSFFNSRGEKRRCYTNILCWLFNSRKRLGWKEPVENNT